MCSLAWQILIRLIDPVKRPVDWLPLIDCIDLERCIIFFCRNRHAAKTAFSLMRIIRCKVDLYNKCIIELSMNDGSSDVLKYIYKYIFESKSSYVFTRCIENLCKNPAAIDIIKNEEYILNDINLIYKICQNPKIGEIFNLIVHRFDYKCWYLLCHNHNAYQYIIKYTREFDARCWISLCYSRLSYAKDILRRCKYITREMLTVLCSNTMLFDVAVPYMHAFDHACWQSLCENYAAIDVIRRNLHNIPIQVLPHLCANHNAVDLIVDMDLIDDRCFKYLCMNKNAMDLVEPILKKKILSGDITEDIWINLAETDMGIVLIDSYIDHDMLHNSNLWYTIVENETCEWFVKKHFNMLKDGEVTLDNNFWEVLLTYNFSSDFKVRILNEVDVAYDIRIDWQTFCHDPNNITWIKNNVEWLIKNDLIYYVYANEAIYEDIYIVKDQAVFDDVLDIILE